MKRIIYVLRSALDLKSQNTQNIIGVDEFVADFEVVFPSIVEPNAIDFMIQSLMADDEEKEMLDKYRKDHEAVPFLVRNANTNIQTELGRNQTQSGVLFSENSSFFQMVNQEPRDWQSKKNYFQLTNFG
jgi:hypothetical protein